MSGLTNCWHRPATIEALAYLIANPVEAGAVRYAKDWPSAQTLPRDIGARVVTVKRRCSSSKEPAHPENAPSAGSAKL